MSPDNPYPIEHVVVLMLENRSYDHLLGYLPNGHGLAGTNSTRSIRQTQLLSASG